jgi:hypothetical protein
MKNKTKKESESFFFQIRLCDWSYTISELTDYDKLVDKYEFLKDSGYKIEYGSFVIRVKKNKKILYQLDKQCVQKSIGLDFIRLLISTIEQYYREEIIRCII